MNKRLPLSDAAARYVHELGAALTGVPDDLRSEMVADVSAQLGGLDQEIAVRRIAELGDPRAIAADARTETRADRPAPSMVYPAITAVLLIAGWYVVPVIGWLAGIAMIAWGERWSKAERLRAILVSAAAAIGSFVVLLIFRGTAAWPVGLGVIVLVPLITNICCGVYLYRRAR